MHTVKLSKTFLFQAIQFSQTVLFQTIQFCISIWPIDRTLSGATTPGQSEPGGDSNEEVLRITQSPNITGISPWDCLVLYTGDLLVGSYPSAEMQSVYSTTPADWARIFFMMKFEKHFVEYIKQRNLSVIFKKISKSY